MRTNRCSRTHSRRFQTKSITMRRRKEAEEEEEIDIEVFACCCCYYSLTFFSRLVLFLVFTTTMIVEREEKKTCLILTTANSNERERKTEIFNLNIDRSFISSFIKQNRLKEKTNKLSQVTKTTSSSLLVSSSIDSFSLDK